MKLQTHTIKSTNYATESLFRIARAMPEDKLHWQPLDNGRTVIDQLQEVAQSPLFFLALIDPNCEEQFGPEHFETRKRERQAWSTIDECEQVCAANSERLYAFIETLPDSALETTIDLPWGETATFADALGFQYWNVVYHQGQINYMQTLYGDTEMH